MVNKNIHLLLIPMPFCTFCAFGLFSFLSPPTCLSFWIFYSWSSIHSVLLCERFIDFQLTDREELWQFCTYMVQYFVLIHIAFLGVFDSYLPFGFQFLAWDQIIYNIMFTLLPFHGSFLSLPQTFLYVRWMEPRNSIPDLLIMSYFTRIK